MNRLVPVVFLAVAMLVGGIVIGRATATTTVSLDSEWWGELSSSQQVAAVQGAISGYMAGVNDGFINASSDREFEAAMSGMPVARAKGIAQHLKVPLPRYSKTFGTYIHEVGDFYQNYPTASSVEVGRIMLCLSDQPLTDCSTVALLGLGRK